MDDTEAPTEAMTTTIPAAAVRAAAEGVVEEDAEATEATEDVEAGAREWEVEEVSDNPEDMTKAIDVPRMTVGMTAIVDEAEVPEVGLDLPDMTTTIRRIITCLPPPSVGTTVRIPADTKAAAAAVGMAMVDRVQVREKTTMVGFL